MAFAKKSSIDRNLALDVLRGHYLIAILIDHFNLVPSVFIYYNGMGNWWVSAAEGFVFIAGILIGMINLSKMPIIGIKDITKNLLLRAFRLYLFSGFLTVIYTLIGIHSGDAPFINKGILYKDLLTIFYKAFTLQYAYGWADLLILYVVLISIAPIGIYMIYKKLWWVVLGCSFALWFFSLKNPNFDTYSGSYFPILSWQFLFFIGMILSNCKSQISKVYQKLSHSKKASIGLIGLFVITMGLNVLNWQFKFLDDATNEVFFGKLYLGVGRIFIFFIWFGFYYFIIDKSQIFIKKYLSWIYLTLGKNSLLTYIAQSAILFGWFYFPKDFLPNNFWANTFINLFVILLNWFIVIIVLKFKNLSYRN